MVTNDNPTQDVLPDVHMDQTGIRFNEPEFRYTGGDRGNGTYRNFIVFADYADPDVLRVGEDYYAISSTFHLTPGITILHSKDLVNWQLVGHVIDDLSKLHPDFSFNAMRAYGAGVWAPSLRRHDGTFYVHVGGPRIGLVVCKAKSIRGPWTVKRMKFEQPWTDGKLIDCCPLWDDDGQAYFAAAEPRRHMLNGSCLLDYKMLLFKMSPDGERLLDSGTLVHGGRTTEAIKLYKFNGWYYMFYVEHPMDENGMRTQFAARSRTIYGPYERRKLIHSHGPVQDMNPSQGGLVDTLDGSWHFLCHGMASEESPAMSIGRPLMLLPVHWKEGWPIIGEDLDDDSVGEMVWQAPKPITSKTGGPPQSSDEFDNETLGPQWQWNHAPRNDAWSLTERPGHLRLRGCKPAYPGGFFAACNTLTQRLTGDTGEARTRLSTAGMADGQYAGLCLMADPSQLIGVYQEDGRRVIRYQYTRHQPLAPSMEHHNKYADDFFCVDLAVLEQDEITLRLEHTLNRGTLSFSLDGTTFEPAFDTLPFHFFAWRGGRVGFFSWNDFTDGGAADFHFLRYP